jgi:protein TonB
LYGAYQLRKKYGRRIGVALVTSCLLVVAAIIIPVLAYFVKGRNDNSAKVVEGIVLGDPPPIDRTTPPPPPIPPPPIQKTIKFTPPKVVRDEEFEEPPVQEEVKVLAVNSENVEGVDPVVDLPPDNVVIPDDDNVYMFVEEMPTFPGGEKRLFELLSHINYPINARENGISGWVYLTFVVDKDGKIRDAKVVNGIGGGCDEEALRVLNALPAWNPGRKNGQNVAVKSNVRINFTLR